MSSLRLRLFALGVLTLLTPFLVGTWRPAEALGAAPPVVKWARKDLFGDVLPEGAIARLGSVRLRHESVIQCIAFTPNGKELVTGSYSRFLVYWDRVTGKELRRVVVSPYNVSSIQYSKNGKVMAIGCGDGTVRILDPVTGVQRKLLQDPMRNYGATYAALSPDGKSVISTTQYGRALVLWDVDTARVRLRYTLTNSFSQHTPMAFTPDGKQFLTLFNDNKVHVFETATGRDVRSLESTAPPNDMNYVRVQSLALSPDGKTLAVGSTNNRGVQLIDLARDKVIKRLEQTNNNYYGSGWVMAFLPNSRFLVELKTGQGLFVWGVASGKVLRQMPIQSNYNPCMALAPNGKLVATASGNIISLFDLNSGKQLHNSSGHQSGISRLAFTGDGKHLVSGGNNTLRYWESTTGKQVALIRPGSASNLLYFGTTLDGKAVRWINYDRSLNEWRIGAEKEARRLTTPPPQTVYYSQTAVSPDGKVLAGIDNSSRKLVLIDLTGAKPQRELMTLTNPWSSALVFSPDGRKLALGTPERLVRVFDVTTATPLWSLLPDVAAGYYYSPRLEFSPDSRSLMRLDNEMRCYEVANGAERFRLPPGGASGQQIAWSADGRLVARVVTEGIFAVYDTHEGRELLRRDGKQGTVTTLAFSRDGRMLATGGANTTILVWDVPVPASGKTKLDKLALWRDLEGNDAKRAYKVLAALAAAPSEAVVLLKEKLKPRAPVDADKLAKLIRDLDSDTFEVREDAEAELAKLGVAAEEALARGVKSRSLEVRRRCETLLGRLQGVPLERLRVLRAIEVLERCHTPAARELLLEMTRHSFGVMLDREVRATLGRLGEAR